MPDVIPLICLRGTFIPSIQRFVIQFSDTSLCTSYLHIPHSLWYILVYTKLYMIYTSIYQVIHDIYWYIPLLYIVVYTNPLHCCRIPLLLSLHFRTALRRIATMFPWRIVGMPVPSSSSIVLCVPRMGNCLKTNTAMLALMTSFTPWFSSIPLKEAGFPFACAYTAALDGRRGSNI